MYAIRSYYGVRVLSLPRIGKVRALDEAARAARAVLGQDSFGIVTIGFDTVNDTPEAMASFARSQGIDASGWRFLSATPETIAVLSDELGFIFFPSPRGRITSYNVCYTKLLRP